MLATGQRGTGKSTLAIFFSFFFLLKQKKMNFSELCSKECVFCQAWIAEDAARFWCEDCDEVQVYANLSLDELSALNKALLRSFNNKTRLVRELRRDADLAERDRARLFSDHERLRAVFTARTAGSASTSAGPPAAPADGPAAEP